MKTGIADLQNLVQKYWSPLFEQELKEETLLPGLVSKKYEGQILKGGDTVYVHQLNRPDAEIRTIGVDADVFGTQKLSANRISIVANKRIVVGVELEDLVELQTQLDGGQDSKIRQSLMEAVEIKLNEYLYGFVSPSSSAPDHITNGVSDMNASAVGNERIKAANAKWPKMDGWYSCMTPIYYQDVLNVASFTSGDYVGDKAVPTGRIASSRYGFTIFEDNSDAILTAGANLKGSALTTAEAALFFHPDFLHLVNGQPNFQLSSTHGAKQFGYVLSLDMWVGAALGNNGSLLHTFVYNS